MKMPDWNKIATGHLKHNAHVMAALRHSYYRTHILLEAGRITATEYECRMATMKVYRYYEMSYSTTKTGA